MKPDILRDLRAFLKHCRMLAVKERDQAEDGNPKAFWNGATHGYDTAIREVERLIEGRP